MGLLDCEFDGIERVYDPYVVDKVSNHPSIFPHISGGRPYPLDSTAFVTDTRNVFLAGEWGLSIFELVEDGIYEMHLRVLPQGRGKWCLGFAIACIAWMFQHEWVTMLVCRVPKGNIACHALVRRGGFGTFVHVQKDGWADEDGNLIDASVYRVTRDTWTRINCNA